MTSKEKVKNFWYYHKYHVLAGVFVLIFAVMTLSECMSRKVPDISIGYISATYKETEHFQNKVAKKVGDVNGDGTAYAYCNGVVFSEEPQMDVDIMMGQKAVVMFASGDYQIYIMDKEYFSAEVCKEMFIDLGDMIDEEMKSDAVMLGEDVTAIKTTHSAFLNEAGFSGDNIYIGISGLIQDNKDSEEAKLLLEAAKQFFKDTIVK